MQNIQQKVQGLEEKKETLINEISYFGSQHEKTKKDLDDIEKRASGIKDNKVEFEKSEALKEKSLIELKGVNSKIITAKKELNGLEKKYADKAFVLEELNDEKKAELDNVIRVKKANIEEFNDEIKDIKDSVRLPIEELEEIVENLKAIKS